MKETLFQWDFLREKVGLIRVFANSEAEARTKIEELCPGQMVQLHSIVEIANPAIVAAELASAIKTIVTEAKNGNQ